MLRTLDLILSAHRLQHGIEQHLLRRRIHAQQSLNGKADDPFIVRPRFHPHLDVEKPGLEKTDRRLDGLEQEGLVFG